MLQQMIVNLLQDAEFQAREGKWISVSRMHDQDSVRESQRLSR